MTVSPSPPHPPTMNHTRPPHPPTMSVARMTRIHPKIIEMAQNGSKWLKMAQNDPKLTPGSTQYYIYIIYLLAVDPGVSFLKNRSYSPPPG